MGSRPPGGRPGWCGFYPASVANFRGGRAARERGDFVERVDPRVGFSGWSIPMRRRRAGLRDQLRRFNDHPAANRLSANMALRVAIWRFCGAPCRRPICSHMRGIAGPRSSPVSQPALGCTQCARAETQEPVQGIAARITPAHAGSDYPNPTVDAPLPRYDQLRPNKFSRICIGREHAETRSAIGG